MGNPCGVACECQLEAAGVVCSAQNQPHCQDRELPSSASDHVYDFVQTLAEGSYGDVHECIHATSRERVAIKRFKAAHADAQIWRLAMRELRVLQTLPRHPNIVELKRAVCSQSSGRLFFVFELLDGSLYGEMGRRPSGFLSPAFLRVAAWQLLQALAHCHDHGVVHRDVKPANVLVRHASPNGQSCQSHEWQHRQYWKVAEGGGGGDNGRRLSDGGRDGSGMEIKLCDFGFARWLPNFKGLPAKGGAHSEVDVCKKAGPDHPHRNHHQARYGVRAAADMSPYVITRWYRPPEVILDDLYGAAADIWSYGCTLAELATGQPLFPGCSSADQLWRITRCLGPLPPGLAARCRRDSVLAASVAAPGARGRTLAQRLRGVSPPLIELITACLELEPSHRPSARDLMRLPYFWDVRQLESLASPPTPAAPRPVALTDYAKMAAGTIRDAHVVTTNDTLAASNSSKERSGAAAVAGAAMEVAAVPSETNQVTSMCAVKASVTEAAWTDVLQAHSRAAALPPVPLFIEAPLPADAVTAAGGAVACNHNAMIMDIKALQTESLSHGAGAGCNDGVALWVGTSGDLALVAVDTAHAATATAVASASSNGGALITVQAFFRRSATAVVQRCRLSAAKLDVAAASVTTAVNATTTATTSTFGVRNARARRGFFPLRASRLLFASVGGNGSHRRLSGSLLRRNGVNISGGTETPTGATVTASGFWLCTGTGAGTVLCPLNTTTSVQISSSALQHRQQEKDEQQQQEQRQHCLRQLLKQHEGLSCSNTAVALPAQASDRKETLPDIVLPVASSTFATASTATMNVDQAGVCGTAADAGVRRSSITGASEDIPSAISAYLDESRLHKAVENKLYSDGSVGSTCVADIPSAPMRHNSASYIHRADAMMTTAAAAFLAARSTVAGAWLENSREGTDSRSCGAPTADGVAAPVVFTSPPVPVPTLIKRQRQAMLVGSSGAFSNCKSVTTLTAGQLSQICSPAGVTSPLAITKTVRLEAGRAPPPPLPYRQETTPHAETIPIHSSCRQDCTTFAAAGYLSTGECALLSTMSLMSTRGGRGSSGTYGGGTGGDFETTSMGTDDFKCTPATATLTTSTAMAQLASLQGYIDGSGCAGAAVTACAHLHGTSRLRHVLLPPPRVGLAPSGGLCLPSAWSGTVSPRPVVALPNDSVHVRSVRAAVIRNAARRWTVGASAATPPVCIDSEVDASMGRCYISKAHTTTVLGLAETIGKCSVGTENASTLPVGVQLPVPPALGSVVSSSSATIPNGALNGYSLMNVTSELTPVTAGRCTLPFRNCSENIVIPTYAVSAGAADASAAGVRSDGDSGGGAGEATASNSNRKKQGGAGSNMSRRLTNAFYALRQQVHSIKAKALGMI